MIECVHIGNNHLFHGNPLYEQHRLRHDCIVTRQAWKVPAVDGMEYDQYDNPATRYLVWRDRSGRARGASRMYPTNRPYMLQEVFPHLVENGPLPSRPDIWEGSRFCIDSTLAPEKRKRIAQELVLSYLEFALDHGITEIVGVMCPAYCRSLFIRHGWKIDWLGQVNRSTEGFKIVAGSLPVSRAILRKVREMTGIYEPVLGYGEFEELRHAA